MAYSNWIKSLIAVIALNGALVAWSVAARFAEDEPYALSSKSHSAPASGESNAVTTGDPTNSLQPERSQQPASFNPADPPFEKLNNAQEAPPTGKDPDFSEFKKLAAQQFPELILKSTEESPEIDLGATPTTPAKEGIDSPQPTTERLRAAQHLLEAAVEISQAVEILKNEGEHSAASEMQKQIQRISELIAATLTERR